MENEHVSQPASPQSESAEFEGAALAPPPFQLLAGPETQPIQRQVIQRQVELTDSAEALDQVPTLQQLMEIYVMEQLEWRHEFGANTLVFSAAWVYGAEGSGHLRRKIRPMLEAEIRAGEQGEVLAMISALSGHEGRIQDLQMYYDTAESAAGMPSHGNSITRDLVDETETEYRIPHGGWNDRRAADGVMRRMRVSRGRLAERMEQLEDPEVVAHVQNTIDMFLDDQDEDSQMTRDQIDLPLVIAIANRESGPYNFLDTSDEQMISSGPDAARGGQGGLDNAGDSIGEFPSEIRDEITPFSSSAALRRRVRPSRRGRVNPAQMPARDMLAGYIVEIERYRQRFERLLRTRLASTLTEAQIDQLLTAMNTDSRRAWIQSAFGSRLSQMLEAQRGIIQRHLRTSSAPDPFAELLADDELNLNAIISTDTIMNSGGGSRLSGHRTRLTAAEASLVEQGLPPSLLHYREEGPTDGQTMTPEEEEPFSQEPEVELPMTQMPEELVTD